MIRNLRTAFEYIPALPLLALPACLRSQSPIVTKAKWVITVLEATLVPRDKSVVAWYV